MKIRLLEPKPVSLHLNIDGWSTWIPFGMAKMLGSSKVYSQFLQARYVEVFLLKFPFTDFACVKVLVSEICHCLSLVEGMSKGH